jgi:hypothetical protein
MPSPLYLCGIVTTHPDYSPIITKSPKTDQCAAGSKDFASSIGGIAQQIEDAPLM